MSTTQISKVMKALKLTIKETCAMLRDKDGDEFGPSWKPGSVAAHNLANKLEMQLNAINADQQSTTAEASEREPGSAPTPIECCTFVSRQLRAMRYPAYADRVDDLIREHEAARQARPHVPEWLPIETAPKDGQYILLWVRHINANYAKAPLKEGWVAAVMAQWLDHNGGGFSWQGLCGVPTHWMPLPAAPSVGVQSKGED